MELLKLTRDGKLITSLQHKDIKAFLTKSIKGDQEKVYKFYVIYLAVLSIVFVLISGWKMYQFIIADDIFQILPIVYGILFSFSLLIIIHELIHALIYKAVGGRNIYFGSDIKKFIFYAASDKHIYNGYKFLAVAIAPFLLVNFIGLLLCLNDHEYIPFVVTILWAHSIFCSGDFAFLNFISKYNLSEFHTYDCRTEQKSFFYILNKT